MTQSLKRKISPEKLRRLRGNRTQVEIAKTLNVTKAAVCNWESGLAKPSGANVVALLELYQARPVDLLEDVQDREHEHGREEDHCYTK